MTLLDAALSHFLSLIGWSSVTTAPSRGPEISMGQSLAASVALRRPRGKQAALRPHRITPINAALTNIYSPRSSSLIATIKSRAFYHAKTPTSPLAARVAYFRCRGDNFVHEDSRSPK